MTAGVGAALCSAVGALLNMSTIIALLNYSKYVRRIRLFNGHSLFLESKKWSGLTTVTLVVNKRLCQEGKRYPKVEKPKCGLH